MAQIFVSAVAHFFMSVGGSKIHERLAHFFIDIYSFTTQKLKLIDTVNVEAFDGAGGVQTRDGYYELVSEIGVYVESRDEFISLQNAKSNYKSFRLYANTSAENGGRIRMIVVS